MAEYYGLNYLHEPHHRRKMGEPIRAVVKRMGKIASRCSNGITELVNASTPPLLAAGLMVSLTGTPTEQGQTREPDTYTTTQARQLAATNRYSTVQLRDFTPVTDQTGQAVRRMASSNTLAYKVRLDFDFEGNPKAEQAIYEKWDDKEFEANTQVILRPLQPIEGIREDEDRYNVVYQDSGIRYATDENKDYPYSVTAYIPKQLTESHSLGVFVVTSATDGKVKEVGQTPVAALDIYDFDSKPHMEVHEIEQNQLANPKHHVLLPVAE